MAKAFFKNISKSVCVYLLAIANLVHAAETDSIDWLCWTTIGLCGLSLVLAYATAKGDHNA